MKRTRVILEGRPKKKGNKLRILIIRPGAIGDALLAFHILKILRARYADPHITLVSHAGVLPLALAFGLVEEVSDYADSAWSELFSVEGIRSPTMQDQLRQIELAICWLRDPDGVVEHNLLQVGVKQVVVAAGRPAEGERMHVVDYLAGTIGLQDVGSKEKLINIRRGEGGVESQPPSPLRTPGATSAVAIHPGSGSARKCWPARNFTAVIEQLISDNIPVVLLAGPADGERVGEILDNLSPQCMTGMLKVPENAPLLEILRCAQDDIACGRLKVLENAPLLEILRCAQDDIACSMLKVLENAPLLEVADRLQQCGGYLGNDSGITHLAAMLGVPTLALFGPSDPVTWGPVGPSVRVIQEYPLERLHVNVVIDTMKSFYLNRIRL